MTYSALIHRFFVFIASSFFLVAVVAGIFTWLPLWLKIIGGIGAFTSAWMFLNWNRDKKERRLAIRLADEAKWKSMPIELDCQFCRFDQRIRWTGEKTEFRCANCGKKNGIVAFFSATTPPDFTEDDTLDDIARQKMLDIAVAMNATGELPDLDIPESDPT